jgi:hypothetical protein
MRNITDRHVREISAPSRRLGAWTSEWQTTAATAPPGRLDRRRFQVDDRQESMT